MPIHIATDLMTSAAHRDGFVRLPDGRRLGYAEFGDPDGPPILYLHGFPGSRLEVGMIPIQGIRVISPDRPGYGLSDPKPGRSLLDWPHDVAALLDHLGLDRVAVVGMSGGAPYAAACAFALPDRVGATALVAGVAPPGHGWEIGSPAGFLMELGARPLALRLTALTARSLLRPGQPARILDTVRRRAGHLLGDRWLLKPGTGERLLMAWQEAMHDNMQGPLSDARIYAAPWGFDPADIQGRVAVWHGTEDRTVPVTAGRFFIARIPGARARIIEGETHFSLAHRHHAGILRDLLGDREAKAA